MTAERKRVGLIALLAWSVLVLGPSPATLAEDRNPFEDIPKGARGNSQGKALVVDGILWAQQEPCAIVGGRIVKVGDTVNNLRVASIGKESVTLSNGHNEKVLTLRGRR